MLVRFRSDVGDILMFGEIAVTLLRMMGQSGVMPGAILAADIPAALERLRSAVAASPQQATSSPRGEDGEKPVSLRQRAFPLIQLLDRAAKKDADVIWDEERSLLGDAK